MLRTNDAVFDDADLNGFVDGRIDPARGAALAESLSTDPEAKARIEGWKRQNESLRTMFASVLSEPVPARLLAHSVPARPAELVETSAQDGGHPSVFGRGVLLTTSVGMGLVGLALGALAGLGFGDLDISRRTASAADDAVMQGALVDRSLAEIAVEAHRTFVGDPIRPVELSAADAPRLERWIQRRLGPATLIPDLARQGWTLIGGRLLPGPHGPVAFLVYGNGPDRLGLTLARSAQPHAMKTLSHAGIDPVSSSSWADEAYGYVFTSAHGASWLARTVAPLAEEIRVQAGDADPLP